MFNLNADDIQKRLDNNASGEFSPSDIEMRITEFSKLNYYSHQLTSSVYEMLEKDRIRNTNFHVTSSVQKVVPLAELVTCWYPTLGYEVIPPWVRESYKKWITGVKNTIH
jgi:hypothetical protein